MFCTANSKHSSSHSFLFVLICVFSPTSIFPNTLQDNKGQLLTISDISYVLFVFQQSHPEIDIAVTPTTPTPTTPTTPLGTTPPSLDSKPYTFSYFYWDGQRLRLWCYT